MNAKLGMGEKRKENINKGNIHFWGQAKCITGGRQGGQWRYRSVTFQGGKFGEMVLGL